LICPMIDARRMEVFTAVFDASLNLVQEVSAKIIDEQSYVEQLATNTVTFIGDGAEKCKAAISDANARFSSQNYNSASNMSQMAFQAFTKGKFEDLAYFEPFYLKDFVLTTPKAK